MKLSLAVAPLSIEGDFNKPGTATLCQTNESYFAGSAARIAAASAKILSTSAPYTARALS